jgi:type I restriction enzyme S subunit
MQSSYKRLGNYIHRVDIRNTDLKITRLLGLSMTKEFRETTSNIVGTDMSVYKVMSKWQFACDFMSVIRVNKLPVVLKTDDEPNIVSPAYPVFEVNDINELNPEYLMMWFRRSEFDRFAYFKCDSAIRGGFDWEALCDIELPILHPDKQREIVQEYNTIVNRIKLNEQLNQKLEETAQALYKQWFVEGVNIENLSEGWKIEKLEKVAKLKYGKMLDSELFLEKGYPVFSGYGVRGYYSEYMYEDPQILVLCRGVSGTGEVKLSPRFAFITNLSIVVEVDSELISKMYLYYYLKNADLRTLDSGSAQSMITTGDLYFQDTLLPPKELQWKFEKAASSIMNEIEIKNQENKKLSELKDLLLSKLATMEN